MLTPAAFWTWAIIVGVVVFGAFCACLALGLCRAAAEPLPNWDKEDEQ